MITVACPPGEEHTLAPLLITLFLRRKGYPVIYLVPGRSGFYSAWFSAGLADVLDELILSGEVPPLIIISTENIESDPLAETIYVELMPFVENQFPVKAERRYRAVAGGSLGGVAAYRLLLQHPEAFSSAGMFGAGLISGEETRVEGWLSSISDDEKIRVFMDTGDEDPLMLDRARVMQATLDEFGVENLLHAGLGGHNYGYWVGNFELYLKWLIQEW